MTMKVVCINKTGMFVRKRKIDKEKVRLLYSQCVRGWWVDAKNVKRTRKKIKPARQIRKTPRGTYYDDLKKKVDE